MATDNRNMRVQVDRLALIRAIESKQKKCRSDYERKGDKHLKVVEKWRNEKVKEMRDEAKSLTSRSGELSKMSASLIIDKGGKNGYLHLQAGGSTLYPPKEREGEQLSGFDTILRMLRMSKKESVSLSEKQFKAYMDGCPI